MTDKPCMFEEWWDNQTERFRRTHSASDYFGGWQARDEEVAAKDRRIEELAQLSSMHEYNAIQYKAQIDRVRALTDRIIEGLSVITPHGAAKMIRVALGEPAATPEREQR